MKAKEYAEKIFKADRNCQEKMIENPENRREILNNYLYLEVRGCIFDLLKESEEIGKIRHAKFDSAYHAILIEQNKKWKAICRLYLGFSCVMFNPKEDYFMSIVDTPELFKELFDKYGR